jgi:hypothetical protein
VLVMLIMTFVVVIAVAAVKMKGTWTMPMTL